MVENFIRLTCFYFKISAYICYEFDKKLSEIYKIVVFKKN